MKVLQCDGSRRVYIFEDFTECPYEDKARYAMLKRVSKTGHSVPVFTSIPKEIPTTMPKEIIVSESIAPMKPKFFKRQGRE